MCNSLVALVPFLSVTQVLARRRDTSLQLALFASAALHALALNGAPQWERPIALEPPISLEIIRLEPRLTPPPPSPPQPVAAPMRRASPARAKAVAPAKAVETAPAVESTPAQSAEPMPIVGSLRIATPPAGTGKEAPAEKGSGAPAFVPEGSVDRAPELAVDCKTDYPEQARHHEAAGTVHLRLTVDAAGQVVAAESLPPRLGHGLNEAALNAVKRCAFRPALKGGRPVGTTFLYRYTFTLD